MFFAAKDGLLQNQNVCFSKQEKYSFDNVKNKGNINIPFFVDIWYNI